MYILAYGTLRVGGRWFDRLNNMFGKDSIKLVKEGISLSGYELRDTGFGYPAAFKRKGTTIVAEVVETTEKAGLYMRDVELASGYEEAKVKIGGLSCSLFFQKRGKDILNMPLVKDGDWIKHISN